MKICHDGVQETFCVRQSRSQESLVLTGTSDRLPAGRQQSRPEIRWHSLPTVTQGQVAWLLRWQAQMPTCGARFKVCIRKAF